MRNTSPLTLLPHAFHVSPLFQRIKLPKSSRTLQVNHVPLAHILILDYLAILITSIINASLEQGKCPVFFKQAHVIPILKKINPLLQ